MITVFADIRQTKNPFFREINDVLGDIKNGKNKERIEAIRKEDDKDKRNKLKSNLRSICFSGQFSYRAAKNCIEHSGFACLDFDDVDKPSEFRDSLKSNEYIYSAFISPSGNGVKAIVRIPADIRNHKKYYESLCETFDTKLDTSTKDICRVCYESYDEDLWINFNSKQWVLKKEYTEVTPVNTYPSHFQITDVDKKVDVITKWFNKKFTLNVGEINNNLYILACALNKAGLDKESALNLFVNYYSSREKEDELRAILESAYKNTQEYNSMVLIDETKLFETERLFSRGLSKAKKELKKEGLSNEAIEEIIDYDFEDDYLVFWDVSDKGTIHLNDYKFKLFLQNRGFYKVQLNDKEFTFVKVYNNIINEVNETNIKDFVLSYVAEIDIKVYNFFAKAVSKFTDSYLSLLDTKKLSMVRDTSDTSYVFFKNKIVKVTEDNFEFIEYIDVDGFVWENNIIQRDFKITDKPSDFETFIINISNNNADRKRAIESSMGYMLNTYKKQDEGVSIIYYDESLSDNPSGRTGKTLVFKALSQIRKATTLNGKEFDSKGNFPYDTISLDDNIICFDDMERNFKFESLFSLITGDMTLKKKFQQPIVIPYSDSPKFLFTSNYILSGVGDSHDARKIEIELHRHYSKDYKPVNEFGKLFFSPEWSDEDWNAFYNYMLCTIQNYFRDGLIRPTLKTVHTKKLIANTCEDFVEFCENDFYWNEEKYYTTKDILNSYKSEDTRELPKTMNISWFGRWVSMYISFKGWVKEDFNTRGVRKFRVIKE